MSPDEIEDHENGEGSADPLDQADLDALISQMAGGVGDPPEEAPAAKEATPEDSDAKPDLLDQSDLDALISGMTEGGDAPPEEAPATPAATAEDNDAKPDLLDQSDLDALISGIAEGGDAPSEEAPAAPEAAPADSAAKSDLLDQSDLDALISGIAEEGDAPTEEAPAPKTTDTSEGEGDESSLVDQAELDALVAGMDVGQERPKLQLPERPDGATAPAGGVDESALLEQADLDALIAGMAEGGEAVEESNLAETSGGESDLLDQAALDALISGVADDMGPPAEPVPVDAAPAPDSVPEESKGLSQAELDELLAGPDADKALDNKELDAEIVAEANGATSGMDAVIGGDQGGGAIDQDGIDALLASASAEESPPPEETPADEGGAMDQAAIDALLAGAGGDASPPEEPAAAPALETADAAQELGSENLAAAGTASQVEEGPATQDAIDDLIKGALAAPAEDAEPVVAVAEAAEEEPGLQIVASADEGQSEPAAEAAEAEEATAKKVRRFRPKRQLKIPFPKVAPETLMKGGLSLAAGLLFGLSTFFVLQNLPRRVPERLAQGIPLGVDLKRAVVDAANLVRSERYVEAMKILESALAGAPASPLRGEGEFLMAEAAYRALPSKPSDFEFEIANSLMANVIDRGYEHPRLIELMRWKAELYDRMGVPDAALRVHDTILTSFSPVPHLDEVLLEAAGYALALHRSTEAADLLRRYLEQFPSAPDAMRAKLMLGEALLDSENVNQGRDLLRQVAVSQPHSLLGAKAYARLGEMAFAEGKYEEAIGELEKRLTSSTTIDGNDEILLMLAKAYRATNRPAQAQGALRDLVQFFPESEETPQLLMELSKVLDDLGQREEATRIAGQAAQRFPENPQVLLNYAHFRELSGDMYTAAQTLLAADTAGAKDPTLLLTAGRQLLDAGYISDARRVFEQLESSYPDTPQAFAASLALAEAARGEGKIRFALNRLEDLAQATEGTPQELPVLLTLGEMNLELGLGEPAAGVYRRLAAATSEPEVLGQAATALLNAGEWSEGLSIAHRVDPAKLSKPTAYAFLMAQGQALLKGDASLAVASMEQAQQDYPEQRSFEADRKLLDAYLAMDQSAKARILVMDMKTRAQPIDADAARGAAIAWGDHLHAKGDFRGAASAYDVALGVDERETVDSQWAMFQRANALLALNDVTGSLQLFEELAGSGSEWAGSAKLKVDYLRLRQRLAGSTGSAAKVQG